jgi:LDH2 family malate/lactate/ureidoglycolate dehydrogenase
VVDASGVWGQIAYRQAMALAIGRAKQQGVCVLALQKAHHIGRAGHYVEMAAAAGAMHGTTSSLTCHPSGSRAHQPC